MADGRDDANGTGPLTADDASTHRPTTLASLARDAAGRQSDGEAQPTGSPSPPTPEAPSPPPPPPAPGRRGPIAQQGSRSHPNSPRQPTGEQPAARTRDDRDGADPSGSEPRANPAATPTVPSADAPTANSGGAFPPGTPLPGPTGAPSDGPRPLTRSANPPPAPPPPYERPDLSDILEQLHEDLDLEAAPAPAGPGAQLTDPRDLERPKDRDEIVVESTGGLDFRPSFASFGSRFVGLVVDSIVLSVSVTPGIALAVATDGTIAVFAGVVLGLIGFAIVTTLYARSVARSGQWLGNRVGGTRVVDARNGQPIDVAHAGTRFVVRHLLSAILLVGFVVAFFDPQRRAFHDRWAGSVVVGRRRESWTADEESAAAAT